ncbi:FAD-containing monooxygenase EthA [Caulobacter flavus]|uniref:FAD-containing monooxygenase EthA n=1 Tax=Caulobacter flavus TaxID=1679497 RepID=A0A2N5CWH8_9CAUL|nr:NAD(P)/FAD-dependent oxidoreductase [Caulobacter flavus]AYV44841.1 FAD-containing monooxygenase EthA [Caulobacter flavus]PLR18155.1 FAD-containing monooxygenase EthA [Caulobacter flavus]
MSTEYFDVLIVGAGLSGVGAAHHLTRRAPGKTYAILEARDAIGGTWDLFRYPGIRSDSDMYTLGYAFKPWRQAKAIADGPSILNYVRETATEAGVDEHIRFRHKVRRAEWSSQTASWTVEAERLDTGEIVKIACGFLYMCAGYYAYDAGYTPDFEGTDSFKGRIVHPQHWPETLDYAGKKVVVIGSGATAVTIVPEMAKTAAHVTMLQRSPTYVVSRPAEDGLANWMRAKLPAMTAYGITRWKNVLITMLFFNLARKKPAKTKERLINLVRDQLPKDYDVETHFTPRYNPWDQRLCLVPDADLFDSIRNGSASVVTDHIERFTESGLLLKSGKTLEADIVVTATGLRMQLMSGMEVVVDGAAVDLAKGFSYKGMMFSDVPNLASAFGYTNASWTLKADLTSEYVCRLLNHMDRTGMDICVPHLDQPGMAAAPWLDFSSGYVQRAMDKFPKQGTKAPWKVHQNYALDLAALRLGKLDDGVMRFWRKSAKAAA